MHRKWLNSARLLLELKPRGPLLVKTGIETPDPSRIGLEFVRTRHAKHGETVYLPGSSLKGVLRSHGERALRGLLLRACNPFDSSSACRQRRKKDPETERLEPPAEVFARQCPICRTFGSLQLQGRCNITDAYPWNPRATDAEQEATRAETNLTEPRTQVGIDRLTGGSKKGALFELEVVTGGGFWAEIQLADFELWQLALLLACIDDLDRGHAAVGFGKSRGLGQVSARAIALALESGGREDGALLGASALADPKTGGDYKLYMTQAQDRLTLPPDVPVERTWRGSKIDLVNSSLGVVTKALGGSLDTWLTLLPVEGAM